ncbi:MAG: DUF6994 family protein [Candidatus Gastranaerophilaceae bacterium]
MKFFIDTTFDFTSDTPHYWDNFWQNSEGLGCGSSDPDSKSPTLKKYHKLLWSKRLPNGEILDLQEGRNSNDYLIWKDFNFGSDSIINVYLHNTRIKPFIEQIKTKIEKTQNYKEFRENYLRKSYTIGGCMIFPKVNKEISINCQRGINSFIKDRFDLTLECIRRYYNNDFNNPLGVTLKANSAFFNLFINFRGFVDFFLLQDLVLEDYSAIKLFLQNDLTFTKDPRPQIVADWFKFYRNQMEFLEKRNNRISKIRFDDENYIK